jgi:hypothetical protein
VARADLNTLLFDDFESYTTGQWPSPSWVGFGGNDSNHSVNNIVEDPEDPNNQVFRLYGVVGGLWGAGAVREIELSDSFVFSCRVYAGGESIPSSGHQYSAFLGSVNSFL